MPVQIDRSSQSPNHSSRHGADINLLVLHATVGGLRSSIRWLCLPSSKVSTHYVLSKSGAIYQLVDDERTAWHAGRASWQGESLINEHSIGIELENANSGRDPYPVAQFEALVELAKEKIAQYHIPLRNVVRHLDIAPGRKSDPAGFPWDRFLARLGRGSAAYRVRRNTVANVRTGPYQNKKVLWSLSGGDPWRGVEVRGGPVTLRGFGSSDVWIADECGRCIWSLLLEKV